MDRYRNTIKSQHVRYGISEVSSDNPTQYAPITDYRVDKREEETYSWSSDFQPTAP